jgi:death-on-curing protein
MGDDDLEYLSADDVVTIHEVIVETSPETTAGVSDRGDVEYVVAFVREGHFGEGPSSIHEKAFHLLRLLVANHPFVDGNKRTALASTVTFYALNGFDLDYDRELKELLKELATDEAAVDQQDAVDYLETNTTELPAEFEQTYQLWRAQILDTGGQTQDNGYDDSGPTE